MFQPRAFLNGEWISPEQMLIPVTDAGFVQGLTVAEQLRTFNGQLFRLREHLTRLSNSLQIVGVDPGHDIDELSTIASELAAHNHAGLSAGDDLGLSIFVTPGSYATFDSCCGPRLGMHTYPLPFHTWADKYETGQSMILSTVRQVPESCWPAELKCRSRMHYYLADRDAQRQDPAARALLLDQEGWVSEASTASVFGYFAREGLVVPPQEKTLPGISVAFLRELAHALELPFTHRPLRPEELFRAEEMMLCSTSPCILPVTRLNHRTVGEGQPGPVFRQLLAAWGQRVTVDLRKQSQQFAHR